MQDVFSNVFHTHKHRCVIECHWRGRAAFHCDQLTSMISFSSFLLSNQWNQLIKPLVGLKSRMTTSLHMFAFPALLLRKMAVCNKNVLSPGNIDCDCYWSQGHCDVCLTAFCSWGRHEILGTDKYENGFNLYLPYGGSLIYMKMLDL